MDVRQRRFLALAIALRDGAYKLLRKYVANPTAPLQKTAPPQAHVNRSLRFKQNFAG